MAWVASVMSGISAALSLVAVILLARLNARSEHRKWLREERVRSAVELKLAVARLRVRYSQPARQSKREAPPDGLFDFSEVNAAMARIDLVGSTQTVSAVGVLRGQLREFVQASTNSHDDWRSKREALDATVDSIVGLVREDVS